MQAGFVLAGGKDQCGGDIADVDGTESARSEEAEETADRFAGPPLFAFPDEERWSGDGDGSKRQTAKGVFEFALDAIVEDA